MVWVVRCNVQIDARRIPAKEMYELRGKVELWGMRPRTRIRSVHTLPERARGLEVRSVTSFFLRSVEQWSGKIFSAFGRVLVRSVEFSA